MARPSHADFMRRAIALALQGKGKTSPNPIVGAVIAHRGRILAEGYHRKAGADHAEIVALKKLKADQAKGSTLYLTFEPCCTYGRTPPCVPAILEKGIRRVVVGTRDPNPAINGRGIQWLKEAGVEVIEDVLHDECAGLNLAFRKYITTKMPYVTLKVALSLDGKIAAASRESKWISSTLSREYVQELRDEVDAILIGGGTLRQDDPRLTVRDGKRSTEEQPYAVIVDAMLDFPEKRKVFLEKGRKIIFATTWQSPLERRQELIKRGAEVWLLEADLAGRVDLQTLLKNLAQKEIAHLLVEGGGGIYSSFIAQGLADRLLAFVTPKLLGGQGLDWLPELAIREIKDSIELYDLSARMVGGDVLIEGTLKNNVHRNH